MELGTNIRTRRQTLGLTLDALAEQTGVSRAMLSDIERGLKNPTIKVVCQIAEGLGCTVSQLIGETLEGPLVITRAADRQTLIDPQSGVVRQLLAPALVRRGLEVIEYTLPPGQRTGVFPAHRPGVVEHITVLSGTLHAEIAGDTAQLAVGDSLFFNADVPHAFHNPSPEPCRYLLLINGQTEH